MTKQTREDYLRAIYCLGEEPDGNVRSVDIGKHLKVSKPAVSEMLKKLKAEGCVEMVPYSPISLTLKGFQKAKKLTYKHRVAELFLREILELEEDKIHEEAHKLEHSLSDEAADKLFELLKNPKACPCGHPILKP
ncbi:metal-dependent transcriptional regulator [Candidatus Peregrinibacteria bacterium]|nr:metal-dependent transcriptional regulator [Candidatus Peregrinibacteria bacterium]MBT7484575.1 metal-dependent transcriptional regulator [Candidatus Peregrinibacteria bacterium]MBT7702842.1 metal-dependent transcriptional regulator [Candidatus Peregrinibacteria bacterium]